MFFRLNFQKSQDSLHLFHFIIDNILMMNYNNVPKNNPVFNYVLPLLDTFCSKLSKLFSEIEIDSLSVEDTRAVLPESYVGRRMEPKVEMSEHAEDGREGIPDQKDGTTMKVEHVGKPKHHICELRYP